MLMSESSYTLYMAFMGILLALVAQLHRSLPEGSIKGIRFAVAVFVVNFGVGWWSLQQLPTSREHHFLIHSHSLAVQGDLSLGIAFPGDMSPGISGTEKLEWDSFPGDIVGPT
ncbi:hypothetical protein Tco_1477489 [Tanacetum coccineum]